MSKTETTAAMTSETMT